MLMWIATYTDGTFLEQFTPGVAVQRYGIWGNCEENKYADIDRNKLDQFFMWEKEIDEDSGQGHPVLFIRFERPEQKLIYRKRNFVRGGEYSGCIYLVGWHENINGTSIKSIIYLYPNGLIELASDKNDLELLPLES